MSLALKILLIADIVTAILLSIYLGIKYGKIFSKRYDVFKMENVNDLEQQPEVSYEDNISKEDGNDGQVLDKNKPLLKEEEKKPFGEKLFIGSFEELEKLIKDGGDKKE